MSYGQMPTMLYAKVMANQDVPEYGYYNTRNTIVVLTIAGLSLLLPIPQYILMGMTLSMMVYIGMNYQAQIKLYGSVQM